MTDAMILDMWLSHAVNATKHRATEIALCALMGYEHMTPEGEGYGIREHLANELRRAADMIEKGEDYVEQG